MKNPYAQTGRTGPFRYAPDGNHHEPTFGQIEMADALVVCYLNGYRYLLLIQRSDGHGYAVPGGHIEPGETAVVAAFRELEEETGYKAYEGESAGDLAAVLAIHKALTARHVPDPRETDDAWAVTTPVVIDLGSVDSLPMVRAGDDASMALWAPAETYGVMEAELARIGVYVFAAHEELLRDFLDEGLDLRRRTAAEGELQQRAWDHIQQELERSAKHPYTVQRWDREGRTKLFCDTYLLDDALPDEDDEQMFVVRSDGERFEVDVEVNLVRRARRA